MEEGDLFDPYNTFFNAGTINNNTGTISNVYGFTVPATNTVEDPGTFCTITFTAQSNTGTSTLHLYDLCVTDENGDCVTDISINDGNVTVIGNNPPEFSNEDPSDGSTDVPVSTSSLSVYISDPEGDDFDWSIETVPDVGSDSGSDENNGTKSCSVSGLDYSTTYTWYVNATDTGSGVTTSESYTFTTEKQNFPPEFSNENPADGSVDVSISLSSLSVYISDPEGDDFDWSIETVPDVGSDSGTNEGNGTKTCIISGLDYETTYTWYVNATDTGSGKTTKEWYTFTTESPPNYPPEFSNENPADGSTNVPVGLASISVYISDPEGDSFDWSIETVPDVGSSSGSGESNGTKTCTLSPLDYNKKYTWYVNATDPGSNLWTREKYTFTTEPEHKPDLHCDGDLRWTGVKAGATVHGNFTVANIGAPSSELDWEVVDWPEWGVWTFNPKEGENLKPEDGNVTVKVAVVAPKSKSKIFSDLNTFNNEYTGEVKIVNKEDSNDFCTINVYLKITTSKQSTSPLYLQILERIINRFPMLGRIVSLSPFLRTLLNEGFGPSIYDAYIQGMSNPKMKIVKPGQSLPKNVEVWTDSDCLFIDENTFEMEAHRWM